MIFRTGTRPRSSVRSSARSAQNALRPVTAAHVRTAAGISSPGRLDRLSSSRGSRWPPNALWQSDCPEQPTFRDEPRAPSSTRRWASTRTTCGCHPEPAFGDVSAVGEVAAATLVRGAPPDHDASINDTPAVSTLDLHGDHANADVHPRSAVWCHPVSASWDTPSALDAMDEDRSKLGVGPSRRASIARSSGGEQSWRSTCSRRTTRQRDSKA